ncbi:unnamed protein product [Toxocara canis]|uniref:Deoxyhypusine hydroxylase n=1 Tax=Toxocara canis TaxID=6265 RepID=A0A183UKT3_TOXCA|nr:unnamed protein product [Toxocara canis]
MKRQPIVQPEGSGDGFAYVLALRQPLATRFRALFVLRNVGCDLSVQWIGKCFGDSSALLKHELAYCLGQTQNRTAIPLLTSVLEDDHQEAIVRHEAGEALGAIGDPSAIPILEKYLSHPEPAISETCDLAVRRIKWVNEKHARGESIMARSPYDSVGKLIILFFFMLRVECASGAALEELLALSSILYGIVQ